MFLLNAHRLPTVKLSSNKFCTYVQKIVCVGGGGGGGEGEDEGESDGRW